MTIVTDKKIAVLGGGPTSLIMVHELLKKISPQNDSHNPLEIYWVAREPKDKLGQGELLGAQHTEVLFNTAVEDMSFTLDNLDEFRDYLVEAGIEERAQDLITRSNDAKDLKEQFVPRHLLRSTPAKLLLEIEEMAREKGVVVNYLRGDVRYLENESAKPFSKTIVRIDEIDERGYKNGIEYGLRVDVAAIAFGSPKKELPNEPELKDAKIFAKNPYQPRRGNILHKETDFSKTPGDYIVGVGGTKLSGVDVAVVLSERGYFDKAGRKLVFFSPSGGFPLPHEPVNTNSDKSYKDNSLIVDVNVPTYLREPKNAKDLTNSILLSVAYATGAVYRDGELHNHEGSHISPKHFERVKVALEEAGDYVKQKFADEGRRVYGFQHVISAEYHPMMPSVWQNFSGEEKVKFVNDGQGVYDTYRHRVPAKVLRMLEERVAAGEIIIERRGIESLTEVDGKISVSLSGGKEITVDSFAKATGWDRKKPIGLIPALKASEANGVVESEKGSGLGVVVTEASKHNTLIVGQLNWVRYFEIQGLQRLLADGRESAHVALDLLEKKRVAQLGVGSSEMLARY